MIPEGRLGSSWHDFGLNLRRILKPASLSNQGAPHSIQSAPKAKAAVGIDRPRNLSGSKIIRKATSGISKRDASMSYASVVARKWKNTSGRGDEGKKKSTSSGVKIVLDRSRITYKKSILGQREQLGEKLLQD